MNASAVNIKERNQKVFFQLNMEQLHKRVAGFPSAVARKTPKPCVFDKVNRCLQELLFKCRVYLQRNFGVPNK